MTKQLHRRDFIKVSSGMLAAAAVATPGTALPWSEAEAAQIIPDKVVPTVCELCFWRCGVDAYVKDNTVYKLAGQENHPLSNGKLCPRGTGGHGLLYDPNRLRHPLIRENGKFRKASWDEALRLIASKFDAIAE